ncbi:MAG: translation initiation factor [Bacteroidetes bacterium]|nr:MAG: translation initiation factor [Bacteroidota bacterium]
MSAKKNSRRGVVYSTDPDYDFEHDEERSGAETLPPAQQTLYLRRQRLKGNKMVTLVDGFVGQDDDLKDLGKSLKQSCGCGGSVKDGQIILQGDFRDKVAASLSKLGYKHKMSGG